MIQRLLASRNLVASLLATATGLVLYAKAPFPEQNLFLELIFLWARPVFLGLKYSYIVSLYTTPFIAYSILLSAVYIFALKFPEKMRPGDLPPYPDPRLRDDLFLVIGEIHNGQTPGPSPSPRWLTIPERGLFTGIAIFGAIGVRQDHLLHPPVCRTNPRLPGGRSRREESGGLCSKSKATSAIR